MYYATHYDFIENQLNTIKKVYDDNKLKYVCLSSGIDSSFGRGYIRWKVEIKLVDGYCFTYRLGEEYQSYRLWCRDYSAYDIFKENNRELRKVVRYFDKMFTEYENDVRRFVELFKMAFPDAKLYNFISEFDFLPSGLNGFDVYMSEFDYIRYTGLVENQIEETTLNTTTKEDIPENDFSLQHSLKWAIKQHEQYNEMKKRCEEDL